MEIERTTLLIGAATVEGMVWKMRKAAYQSGLEGAAGYPLDVAAEIATAEKAMGRDFPALAERVITDIVDQLNSEYEAGRNANKGERLTA